MWVDANGNGMQDPGEPGLGGVTVTIYYDPDGNGVYDTPYTAGGYVATRTTAADGSFIFDSLPPGSYVVKTTAPAGYTQTGDPDGVLDNATTSPVVLGPGDVWVNADFGYQPAAGAFSSIGDTVWLDADRNNAQNAGEPGIAGVTVSLIRDTNGNGVWDAGEPIIATDITDALGQYSFTGLPVADGTGTDDYLVWVSDTNSVLSALVATFDADGAAPATGVKTGLGISALPNLTPVAVTNQDFAFAPLGQDAGEGLIGDTIYLDRNTSGAPDPGEGLEGVKVQLYAADGTTLLATTTTNENGQYFFGGLNATLTYVVKVDATTLPAGLTNTVDPDGGTANQATVNLATSGPVNLLQDFGYRDTSSPNTIAGTIWKDTDANGTLTAGETSGWAGVTVALLDSNGNLVATTTTDASGNYSFGNLPDGTYKVDGDGRRQRARRRLEVAGRRAGRE